MQNPIINCNLLLQVQALPAAYEIPVASLFDFVTGLETLLLVPKQIYIYIYIYIYDISLHLLSQHYVYFTILHSLSSQHVSALRAIIR
jgi:hypothetical protein